MTLGATVKRACRLPPHVLARKIAGRMRRGLDAWRARRHDLHAPTYAPASAEFERELPRYFALPKRDVLESQAATLRALAERWLDHRFDLLGSGWVQVRHGMECKGVEGFRYPSGPVVHADAEGDWLAGRINAANLAESRRLWRAVDPGYVPIDWHLDFKSGDGWRESTWYRDIRYGERPGVDVKVPWELARMQHLPALALAHALGGHGDRPARAFRNQVLDFLATNPPRFGVNWHCTMDVAIRACNWLAAYDLFRAGGAAFDPFFRSAFHRTVREHAEHIAHHLEWNAKLRGNHYLADIVGLIFTVAYLPRSAESDAWLALGVQELIDEVALQFDEDGANFEASCSYHRLSAEMVVFAAALVLGLPPERLHALREYDHRCFVGPPALAPAPLPLYPVAGSERVSPFPPWFFERVRRMARFSRAITRPDGLVPQIGDNDNGRFLNFHPGESLLCHAGLGATVAGLFGDEAGLPPRCETGIVRALTIGPCAVPVSFAPEDGQAADSIGLHSYPRFGLFVYRTANTYLAIRCGSVGQNGHGGHAHNDQLSIELAVDGWPLVVDSGTYLYTPAPEQRNRFRATAMHNTLSVPGREQNPWPGGAAGLFRMTDRARAVVRCCEPDRFIGEHHGFGVPCRRTLLIEGDRITGIDECLLDGPKDVWFHLTPGVVARPEEEGPSRAAAVGLVAGRSRVRLEAEIGRWLVEESIYSPGYGAAEPCLAVRLRSEARRIVWRFQRTGGG
jgi:hypothetical protein